MVSVMTCRQLTDNMHVVGIFGKKMSLEDIKGKEQDGQTWSLYFPQSRKLWEGMGYTKIKTSGGFIVMLSDLCHQ